MMAEACVLVSGGVDSYVAFFEAVRKFGSDSVIGLFVDYGQPYVLKEQATIQKLFLDGGWDVQTIQVPLCEYQRKVTPEDPEVYGRNLLLAFYGALFGKRIWLSSLESEVGVRPGTWDHGPIFTHTASALFSQIFQSIRPETILESPFSGMTKSQVIAHARLNLDLPVKGLETTVSCYADTKKPCGECKACFKRWVAFTNNSLEEDFRTNPAFSQYATNLVGQMREVVRRKSYDSRLTRARCVETHNAYLKAGIFSGKIFSSELELIGA